MERSWDYWIKLPEILFQKLPDHTQKALFGGK